MDKKTLWEKVKKAFNQQDELLYFSKMCDFSQIFCKIVNTEILLFKISLSWQYVNRYDLNGFYRGIYYAVNRKVFNIKDLEFFNFFNPINYKKRIHDTIDWILDYYEFKASASIGINLLIIQRKKHFKKLYENMKLDEKRNKNYV